MTLATSKPCDRAVEWLFASMMLAWGFFLWLPFETFAAPQYALLKALAPEPVWGAFSVSIGGMRMAALVINGQVRQTPLVRALGAGLGMIWWMVLSFLFWTAPVTAPPAGIAWYPIFILFEGYSVLRSAADAYVSGAMRRRPASV